MHNDARSMLTSRKLPPSCPSTWRALDKPPDYIKPHATELTSCPGCSSSRQTANELFDCIEVLGYDNSTSTLTTRNQCTNQGWDSSARRTNDRLLGCVSDCSATVIDHSATMLDYSDLTTRLMPETRGSRADSSTPSSIKDQSSTMSLGEATPLQAAFLNHYVDG
jgi:hypothetical protein